jgi:hypothetical protein
MPILDRANALADDDLDVGLQSRDVTPCAKVTTPPDFPAFKETMLRDGDEGWSGPNECLLVGLEPRRVQREPVADLRHLPLHIGELGFAVGVSEGP